MPWPMLKTVLNSTAKLSITVLCLLFLSCSTTKQTSRFLNADYISGSTFRMSDTLDLYYFPPLRDCMYMQNKSEFGEISALIKADKGKNIQNSSYIHARAIRHATANVADTTHYQVNEQKQGTTVKQPPAPMIDTGRKIVISIIIFFGFVFIASLILVIWKLLRLTGSQ